MLVTSVVRRQKQAKGQKFKASPDYDLVGGPRDLIERVRKR